MASKPAPPIERLVLRISVSISDRDYGADSHYASTSYHVTAAKPAIPVIQAATDLERMLLTAFAASPVKAAYETMLAEAVDGDT